MNIHEDKTKNTLRAMKIVLVRYRQILWIKKPKNSLSFSIKSEYKVKKKEIQMKSCLGLIFLWAYQRKKTVDIVILSVFIVGEIKLDQ